MSIAPTAASSAANVDATIAKLNGRAGQGASGALASAEEQSDRFLTLLVTQMKNQDPLNPMDNAQVTTQMAQISTVSGIDKLAATVAGMNALLLQSQSLEGAMLVGKDVLVAGNKLTLDASGSTTAGFELDGSASSVTVSVRNAAGKVIDTFDMGALGAGRHFFEWTADDAKASGLSFEVNARSGTSAVGLTRLVSDRVDAVYADQGQLTIELRNGGSVKYSDVKAVS